MLLVQIFRDYLLLVKNSQRLSATCLKLSKILYYLIKNISCDSDLFKDYQRSSVITSYRDYPEHDTQAGSTKVKPHINRPWV
jgi:hypothetical protein